MRRPFALLLLAFGVIAAAPATSVAQDVGHPIGTRIAPLQVENLDGVAVDLGQFIGRKPVLIEFWATWCSVCAALEPRMTAAQRRYGSQVEFIRVAVGVNQTVRSIRRHLEDHVIPGRMVFDKDGRATRAFEAPATSYVVILDRTGRVAYGGIGEDQDLNTPLARVVAAR